MSITLKLSGKPSLIFNNHVRTFKSQKKLVEFLSSFDQDFVLTCTTSQYKSFSKKLSSIGFNSISSENWGFEWECRAFCTKLNPSDFACKVISDEISLMKYKKSNESREDVKNFIQKSIKRASLDLESFM